MQHWELLLSVALGETWQLPERVWTGQEQWELPQWQALPEGPGSQEASWPQTEGPGLPQLEPQGQQMGLPGQGLWDRSWQQKEQREPVERLEHQGLGPVGQQQDSQETSQLAPEGQEVTMGPWGQPGKQAERWHRRGPRTGKE